MLTTLTDALMRRKTSKSSARFNSRGWDAIGHGSPWRETDKDRRSHPNAGLNARWKKYTGMM